MQRVIADVFGLNRTVPRSKLGKLKLLEGSMLTTLGTLQMLVPDVFVVKLLGLVPPLDGEQSYEEGYFRFVGFLIAYVGLMSISSGLADNRHAAAVGVSVKSTLYPIGCFALVLGGAVPAPYASLMVMFVVVFAIATAAIYKREATSAQGGAFADGLGLGRPLPTTKVAKGIMWQILLALPLVFTWLLLPDLLVGLLVPAFSTEEGSYEKGYFRLIGLIILVIGSYHFFGARSANLQFAAVGIIGRVFVIPVAMLGFIAAAVVPIRICLLLLILDPVMGLMTLGLYLKAKP